MNGVFFRDQAIALHEYGHNIGIISAHSHSLKTIINKRKLVTNFEVDEGVSTFRKSFIPALPAIPYGNYLLWRYTTRKLFKEYVKRFGFPEIIHAHSALYAGKVASELGSEHDIPVVLTEHSTAFARNLYQEWQLKLITQAVNTVSCCIAVSPSLGSLLSQQLQTASVHWHWVPNVVSKRFDKAVCQKKNDRKGRPVRLLNLALMTEKKGQIDLLKAFAAAFTDQAPVELWLGGDGPLRPTLEQLSQELGICDRVRFLGLVPPESVPVLMSEVDVMVLPSHYETFGVVAAEALMVGLPVIATRCGGPECIVGPNDGFLIEPHQPEQLVQALKEIVKKLQLYSRTELSARAHARFSGLVVAEQLTKIYHNTLQSKNNKGIKL
ncbi:glycosyltransferase [Nitrincola alkalilacustris]|uniref:glycosyltransferase n=1 Tax=Nitrincola alkalilacustris TaxID=1571224 RepID=UPI00145744B1|nr:glycosyltransferase [Nitrincola alkalilacustris]